MLRFSIWTGMVPSVISIVLIVQTWTRVSGMECSMPCKPINNVSTFCDYTEERCSPCIRSVCATFENIPAECTCFCIKEFPERQYKELDKRACSGPVSTDNTEKTTTNGNDFIKKHQNNSNAYFVPVVVISSVLFLLIICGLLYCFRRKIMDIWGKVRRSNGRNGVEAGPMLELQSFQSVLVTSAHPPNDLPALPSAVPTRGSYRASSVGEDSIDAGRLRHVHRNDIGPQHPSEGVPGDYAHPLHIQPDSSSNSSHGQHETVPQSS